MSQIFIITDVLFSFFILISLFFLIRFFCLWFFFLFLLWLILQFLFHFHILIYVWLSSFRYLLVTFSIWSDLLIFFIFFSRNILNIIYIFIRRHIILRIIFVITNGFFSKFLLNIMFSLIYFIFVPIFIIEHWTFSSLGQNFVNEYFNLSEFFL